MGRYKREKRCFAAFFVSYEKYRDDFIIHFFPGKIWCIRSRREDGKKRDQWMSLG